MRCVLENNNSEFDIVEHVGMLNGYFEAMSLLNNHPNYKHCYSIGTIDLPVDNVCSELSEIFDIKIHGLKEIDDYLPVIEKDFNELMLKNFLNLPDFQINEEVCHLKENLIWHAVEYITWLDEFTNSFAMKMAEIIDSDSLHDKLYLFFIDEKYLVYLNICIENS